ncbi:hypothetical protein GGX14DRAFT_430186 [Mycena pura]|uniref:Zn(2)-C6 fungal-type domain-containing protein n=1 Tax=Mycena pura TaxID=153505 RepID=A0AAD6VSQ9_9AGAR|nr:hypothetical protein GGX14DRAFT_430186 [Mycena pura]
MNMDKPAKATCGRCRAKKIRCDGQLPCGPCLKGRIDVNCSYTAAHSSISNSPSDLRKGAACIACRRKKKKCTGDWPCHACIAAKKEDDCKYNDGSQLSFTRALIDRTLELEQLLSEAKQAPQDMSTDTVDINFSAELDQLLSSNCLAPEPILFDPDLLFNPEASDATYFLPEENTLETQTMYDPTAAEASTLEILQGPEEKMLRLRKAFLAKRIQFGFILPAHKLAAVINGDLSGTIVHPVLVHVCHLWGYMLEYCEKNRTWTSSAESNADEVEQLRLVLGSLAGVLGPAPDPVTTLMTYLSVSLYFFHMHDFRRGQEFLTVASNTALMNDLDLAALAYVRADEDDKSMYSLLPLTDGDEVRSAYSALIYVAMSAQVVLAMPSVVDSRLVETFDRLMTTDIPNNADINFQRAKSVRLLKQTRELTFAWNHARSPPPSWAERYWKLVEQLHIYVGRLKPIQLRASFIPDAHTTELVLKISSTIALAALADLHSIFAPSHVESSKRYRDAVLEIVCITSTFSMDDCQYLDPILPVCWSVATKRILDNQVMYENQESIIAAIRECNQNLQQVLPLVTDFETLTVS